MNRKFIEKILIVAIFILIAIGVGLNYKEQYSIDRSKIPEKVETNKYYQRWITNLKNKDLEEIKTDDFRLKEENEIYNTKWMKIYSTDEEGKLDEFNENLENHKNIKRVVFGPSGQLFVDYRNEERDGYKADEVHFYGIRDDKIIDTKILDCSLQANCYFDRAYFLTNDLFVVTEFSRNVDKKNPNIQPCKATEECEYTVKLHLVDLINNSRLVYESKPFTIILSDVIPEL